MKGSPQYLARQMMRTVSARNVTKLSRHEMKAKVRSELEAKGDEITQANVAKHMPVYSHRTEAAYRKAWERFFAYVRMEHGVRDPARVKRWHVEEFLQYKINQNVKLRTFKGYAAAIGKLEIALNNVRKYPLHYSKTVDRMREQAKATLDGSLETRAYKDPLAVINELRIDEYKLAAELQFYGGARVSEISELKFGRNLIGTDGEFGKIRLTNTKGGRVREMRVSQELYERVSKLAREKGKFEFSRGNYNKSLKSAVVRAKQKWHGTH